MSSKMHVFAQVKKDIIDMIAAGKILPGGRLPTQQELCEIYKISHMTMRRVVNELIQEGDLYAVAGKGIFVSEPKQIAESGPLISFTEDMARRGMVSSSKILETGLVTASMMIGMTLQVEPGAPLVYLRRLRLVDNMPVAIQSASLDYRFCHGLLECDMEKDSLYAILRNKFGLHLVNSAVTIGTELASKEIADLLQMSLPASLLVTEQITYLESGKAIEYVRSVYRGDRYQIVLPSCT